MNTLIPRRALAALSMLTLLCGLLIAGILHAASASAGTDDYPARWRNAPMVQWPFLWGLAADRWVAVA
jgi:hypothetical protein